MSRLHLPATTTERVQTRVRVDGGLVNPTLDGEWHYLLVDHLHTPDQTEWDAANEATWAEGGPPYRLEGIVGPVDPGSYAYWVRGIVNDEQITRRVGIIEFD